MNQLPRVTPVKLHSTTLNQPVLVYPQDVVAITFLDKNKSTALIMTGGSAIPVAGTLEEVEQIITAAKSAATTEGDKN